MSKDCKTYKEVRSVKRALSLFDAIGEVGWVNPSTLSQMTGIDRATVYRLLATMVRAGYLIKREQDEKHYLSNRWLALGRGIHNDDIYLTQISEPLASLTKAVKWPSDFGILSSGQLVIVDSTHAQTSMTFYRSVIGKNRPVFRSALGKALIAGMSDEQRQGAIDEIRRAKNTDALDLKIPGLVLRIIDDFKMRGYALSVGEATKGICAIALPVRSNKRVIGAVNIVMFHSAFDPREVEGSLLNALKKCVDRIEKNFRSSGLHQVTDPHGAARLEY